MCSVLNYTERCLKIHLTFTYKFQDSLQKKLPRLQNISFDKDINNNKSPSRIWFLNHLLQEHSLRQLQILLIDDLCPLIFETGFHIPEKHKDV